jgi:YfiH family protein
MRRFTISIMSNDDFILREIQGIPYYSCRIFESLPRLRHGFSTRHDRHGGTSGFKEDSLNLSDAAWDSPERVRENQRRFLSAVQLEAASLFTLNQVHSNQVHIVNDVCGLWNPVEGDALITQAENAALAIKVGDCLPVLIADPAHAAVAAVHSGWRGTLSGILPHTIREMRKAFNSHPSELHIAIGPGIRSCCFEVGPEVACRFDEGFPGAHLAKPIDILPGKFHLDLSRALEIQLDHAGVPQENCHDLGACTCCNTKDFFSYRAEGAASGRMMAVIGISAF